VEITTADINEILMISMTLVSYLHCCRNNNLDSYCLG